MKRRKSGARKVWPNGPIVLKERRFAEKLCVAVNKLSSLRNSSFIRSVDVAHPEAGQTKLDRYRPVRACDYFRPLATRVQSVRTRARFYRKRTQRYREAAWWAHRAQNETLTVSQTRACRDRAAPGARLGRSRSCRASTTSTCTEHDTQLCIADWRPEVDVVVRAVVCACECTGDPGKTKLTVSTMSPASKYMHDEYRVHRTLTLSLCLISCTSV